MVKITLLLAFSSVVQFTCMGWIAEKLPIKSLRPSTSVMMSNENPELGSIIRNTCGVLGAVTCLSTSVVAADYAPSTPPPQLVPQVVRQSPKALQSGAPEKWIYSKFLDEVEKDDVEKVTFSPDGKKAVGVDTDGDRFVVDIPNDPNLLSFLVQHKVEINVAPINANGGVSSSDSTALQIPSSDLDKLIQVCF